jgi:hypothetical protein
MLAKYYDKLKYGKKVPQNMIKISGIWKGMF